jgi:transposase
VLRGLMSDMECAFFAPFLIENRSQGGRRPADHRRVLDGVLYVTRTGVPWRDLPPEFGNWNSVHRQYRRWTEAGVWDVMLAALAESEVSDNTTQMIDSTIVRVHQHGAGGRGGFTETVLAVRAVGSRPRFIPERMRKDWRSVSM